MVSRRLSLLILGLTALATAGALTLVCTADEVGQGENPAATAVQALTADTAQQALATVPEDFAAVLGYEPILEGGHLVHAGGGCSSPVPLPDRFEPVCRQHDYGYDLLRYAELTGDPLGRWARGSIDDQFAERVRAACTDASAAVATSDPCLSGAQLAITGVELNSVRQGDGVPEESVLTSGALVSSALGALGMAGAAVPRSRRDPAPTGVSGRSRAAAGC